MRKKLLYLSIFSLVMMVPPARAEVAVSKNLFQRGSMRASLSGAMGWAFDQQYLVMGLGVGYYVTNGLELGLDGEAWWGDSPNIYKLSPEIRYVFYRSRSLIPYIGAFYRRTYFESLNDLDSYGGRAGVYTRLGSRGYAGAGVVYEKYADCNKSIYSSCDATYPEFIIGASF